MIVKQFEDEPLAHFSYAIISEGKMALVDPSRNPIQYYEFAEEKNASIVAVFETHPHADFVSSHLQIHEQTGATIYVSKDVGADYPHKTFDEPDEFEMNEVTFSAINTPGHSPDSISIVAKDGENTVVFTGDTLFVGDVGRPDLREKSGNMQSKREKLASMMYHTIQNKYNHLPDKTIVYPAHGAGTLCGKSISEETSTILGEERKTNWAFQEENEEDFVETLTTGQPFIPSYFSFDVEINKKGATNDAKHITDIPLLFQPTGIEEELLVDLREEKQFKVNHYSNSINIQGTEEHHKFETWLGAIIQPEESFGIVVGSINDVEVSLYRAAKIGYEQQISKVIVKGLAQEKKMELFDLEDFKNNTEEYTIVDIRNKSETNEGLFFDEALTIPLNELRERIDEILTDKPVVVHCAGGYRSAIGSSILHKELPETTVFDLSDSIKKFK